MYLYRCRLREYSDIRDDKQKTLRTNAKLRVKLPTTVFIYLLASENYVYIKDNGKKVITTLTPTTTEYELLSGCIVARCEISSLIETNDTKEPFNYVIENLTIGRKPTPIKFKSPNTNKLISVSKLETREKKQ